MTSPADFAGVAPLSSPVQPVRPQDRILLIDALRGLALLGILLVNISYFASPYEFGSLDRPGPAGTADRVAEAFVQIAAEGKFYALFSLLFGLGLFVQMGRVAGAEIDFRRRWRRRMLILLAVGIGHAVLIWDGDILVTYGLYGILLPRFRRRSDRSLVRWATVLVLVPALVFAGLAAGVDHLAHAPEGRAELQKDLVDDAAVERATATRVYGGDDWSAMVKHRLKEYPATLFALGLAMGPSMLAMFLVGMLMGRRGLLQAPADHKRTLWRLFWFGLALGVPLTLLRLRSTLVAEGTPGLVVDDLAPACLSMALMFVVGPLLCLAYVAGAALLWQRPAGRRVLAFFTPVGRMALTNYLLQSLVATFVFYGHGLGYYGQGGSAVWLGIATAIYAAQVVLSRWWLSHHHFGPAEWLWRTLTYGRRQPLRREVTP